MQLLNRINNVLLQMTYSLLVKSQKAASQIVTIGCVLFLVGCDNDNSNNDVAPERARLIKIIPAVSEIERYTREMALVFDKPVAQVKVNGIDADPNPTMSVGAWRSTPVWILDLSLFEKIYPKTHPLSTASFAAAQVCFTVSYVDEITIYQEDLGCVELPFRDRGQIPPGIIEGTVNNGDVDVDADKLNLYGFTFQFSDRLTGYIAIYPEGSEKSFGGESLGWNVEWSEDGAGESVRLYRKRVSKKLLNGRAYTITFDARDGQGNPVVPYTITFTTKA